MNDSTATPAKRPLAVYAIIDRNGKSYWMKLGAAFSNRDGSVTLYLDAVPVGTHRLQVREQRPWDEVRPGGAPSAPVASAAEAGVQS